MANVTSISTVLTLPVRVLGEQVDIALSGTYVASTRLEKAVTMDGTAWNVVRDAGPWTTANATVAFTFITTEANTLYRLNVYSYTSGTLVATIADTDKIIFQDNDINFTRTQAGMIERGTLTVDGATTLTGNTTLAGSFQQDVISITGSTLVMTAAANAGRIHLLNRSGGIDIDLPDATGSGAVYEFYVGTATTDAYELSAFDTAAAAIIQGVVCGVDAAVEFTWGAAATDNTVTLGGTSQATGGTVGDYIRLVDIATDVYSCSGFLHQGGTEATPFSTDS